MFLDMGPLWDLQKNNLKQLFVFIFMLLEFISICVMSLNRVCINVSGGAAPSSQKPSKWSNNSFRSV